MENPEELNTRTAPEEVSQFVQKNGQQSKLTTVNKLQAPQHLFCFPEKDSAVPLVLQYMQNTIVTEE